MRGRRLFTVLTLLTMCMVLGCSGAIPSGLGVKKGRLSPCPDSPNCVSSQAANSDQRHFILPLSYQDDIDSARRRLVNILAKLPRNRIVEQSENYLRVEFSSALMGFVDDVEFYFPEESLVQVRSASRLGYSDFGVNRKRIEQIRQMFQK